MDFIKTIIKKISFCSIDEKSYSSTQIENYEQDINSESSYKIIKNSKDQDSINMAIQNNFLEDSLPYMEIPEKILENKNEAKKFKVEFTTKKRGRKPKNMDSICSKNKKEHAADEWDNVLRKIQVHFLNFIISFLNDIIYNHLKKKDKFFLKFSYSAKENIKFEHVEKLKKYNIKELIENLDVSSKYKSKKLEETENINMRKLKDLSEYNWFNEFINKNILELFEIYYNNKKPLESIYFNGKEIVNLKEAKNFYFLLQKYKKYEEKLIEAAERVYLY